MRTMMIALTMFVSQLTNAVRAADAVSTAEVDRYGRFSGTAIGRGDSNRATVRVTEELVDSSSLVFDKSGRASYSSTVIMKTADGRLIGKVFTMAVDRDGGSSVGSSYVTDVYSLLKLRGRAVAKPESLRSEVSASSSDDAGDDLSHPETYRATMSVLQGDRKTRFIDSKPPIDHAAYFRSIRPVSIR